MNLFSPSKAIALVLVVLAAICSIGSQATAAPNIVVIMTDDQRDADPLDRMPKTEALLVKQGLRFTNSFVVNPVCCASRASFLSGQYSHNDNVWDNKPGERPGGFRAFKGDDNTIACWTQAAGYRTGLIGKYLNGYGKARGYIPPCWNYWWGLTRPFRYYDYEVNDNGTLKTYGFRTKDYQEDVVSRLAQKFIAGPQQPFFLWITGIAPHGGYPGVNLPVPPPRYKGYFRDLKLPRPPNFNESDISDKPKFMQRHAPLMDRAAVRLATQSYRRRAETVLAADDMVGDIVNELQRMGLLENTYIVFTSDNGFFNGEHRLPVGKHLFYEESLRVPFVIRGPGIPADETRTQMVNNLDLTATIVELAGATAGRASDGRSLVPLFSSGDAPWRTAMLVEGAEVLANDDGIVYGYYSGVRTAGYKYGEQVNNREKYVGNEFYDLTADPYEVDSRPDDPNYKRIVDQLKATVADLRACKGDSCWVDAAPPHSMTVQQVKPQIGPVCRNCVHRDFSRSLEPSESSTVR
jgi:N-acetylglucosamine-6-sulfatase